MAGLRAVQAVACGCGAFGKLDALIQRFKPEVGIGVGTVTRVFVEPEVSALTAKFAGVALLVEMGISLTTAVFEAFGFIGNESKGGTHL